MDKNYQAIFENLLKEYRSRGIHFIHLKTDKRDLFFIIDDSYYLTYRDDKKEIALSIPLLPKDNKHEKIYHYNTNNRSIDEWYDNVNALYNMMSDKDFYNAPNFYDIQMNYLNEEEKVPLKDFLAVIPKTTYKLIGNYIIFDQIGCGLDKTKKKYHVEESGITPLIRYWLNEEEMSSFNYELREPINSLAINFDDIEEIVPAHTNVRFVFDNGSVKVFKKILDKRNEKQ